jgi:hypothetical protein
LYSIVATGDYEVRPALGNDAARPRRRGDGMDFWDLVTLMWRRWYVTAPMLLLTLAGVGWIMGTVGPEYQATGYVTVVPPTVFQPPEAGKTSRVNPWNEEALADAARIRLEGKSLRDELAAAGFVGEWAVEITGRLPVISVQVVAPTSEQALTTVHELQGVVEAEVQARQAEYDLPEGEQFTAVRYDQGESVETTASRMRRTLVAVVAAGLFLTAAVVVSFDALARWRLSRRGGGAAAPLARATVAAAGEPRRGYLVGTAGAGVSARANGATASALPNGAELPLPVPLAISPTPVPDPVPTSPAAEPPSGAAVGAPPSPVHTGRAGPDRSAEASAP